MSYLRRLISEFHDASAVQVPKVGALQSINPLLRNISMKFEDSVWQMTVICLYLLFFNLTQQPHRLTFCVGP